MAYSQFSLRDVEEKLSLLIKQSKSLFEETPEIEISEHLSVTLKDNIPLALNINTEKARSEMLIAPMLIEVRKLLNKTISLFSGVEFNIDDELGLNGICDFVICHSPTQLYVDAPIITIVEAKNENIKSGLAQCIAEMYAAKIFNQRSDAQKDILGIVTTGSNWKFLLLSGKDALVDYDEYLIDNPGKILGIIIEHIKK